MTVRKDLKTLILGCFGKEGFGMEGLLGFIIFIVLASGGRCLVDGIWWSRDKRKKREKEGRLGGK